ncbi:hypothetical protein KEM48_009760 [Puccinia striiformis f. sp. tritici PST-130]|uniref:Uncharacterized protein n=1 Tax=Puccinia striiformis f. sp. tritici PST-78 TaxID=1165861 RepID=A0A0L0W0Y9_9BASI|nr:hypothetical protein H4Q26_010225 [Puccinia striiformis f. sp. tritici PST-130]KAI9622827.1 hypothetical protein KEM48_009760 [Puccinia striiformis f. sp. tritici PST-130]KNF05198.1 hypothetical protein PSTG_01823 [Puccinia striiformis f. sp. tritici PST-78]
MPDTCYLAAIDDLKISLVVGTNVLVAGIDWKSIGLNHSRLGLEKRSHANLAPTTGLERQELVLAALSASK